MEGDRGGEEEEDNYDTNRAAVFGIQIHLLDPKPHQYHPDEVKGDRPEWVTRRAVVLFLKQTLCKTHYFPALDDADTFTSDDADTMVNDLMAVLNLLTINVKEVAKLRPKEVHTIDEKDREAVLITAKAQMNNYVSRVLGYTVGPFLGEIAAKPKAGIKLLQIFFRDDFGRNKTYDSAVFGPQVLAFVTDLLRPIVIFFRDQLQQGIDYLSIEQASRAISDLAGLVRLAPLPSNPKNTAMILNGHLKTAASLMPGFVHGGLNCVNLLRVFYFGLAGSTNRERGSPFLSSLDQTIRREIIDFFRSKWMARADLMVGGIYFLKDDMALRFLLAFLCIASTETLPLDEIEVLEMFHRNIRSSRPILPRFADIGKEGPDVRLSGQSKSRRTSKEIAEDDRVREARRQNRSEGDEDDNRGGGLDCST